MRGRICENQYSTVYFPPMLITFRIKAALRGLWQGFTDPFPPTVRSLGRRLDAVEDDVEHLGLRVTRLYGRVTGTIRRAEPDAEPEEPAADPDQLDLNEKIKRGEVNAGGFGRVRIS